MVRITQSPNLDNNIPECKQKDHHSDIPMGHRIPVDETEPDVRRQGYKSCNDAGIKVFITSNSKQPSQNPTVSTVAHENQDIFIKARPSHTSAIPSARKDAPNIRSCAMGLFGNVSLTARNTSDDSNASRK